jgi:hypothetical protein
MQGKPPLRLPNDAHELALCILPSLCFLFSYIGAAAPYPRASWRP